MQKSEAFMGVLRGFGDVVGRYGRGVMLCKWLIGDGNNVHNSVMMMVHYDDGC